MTKKKVVTVVEPKPPQESKTVVVGSLALLFFVAEIISNALTDDRVTALLPEKWAKWAGAAVAIAMLILRFRTVAPLTTSLDHREVLAVKESTDV